jgi:hypothetical protein
MSWKSFSLSVFVLLISCSPSTDLLTQSIQTSKPESTQVPATPTSIPLLITPEETYQTLPTSDIKPAQPLSFELLGSPATYRELSYHHAIWDLQLWHERIYIAHGDWYINSGPLRMLYYDLLTGEFVHDDGYMLNEEGIEIFRIFEDALYIPGVEATEHKDNAYLYRKIWREPWVRLSMIPNGVHLWDVVFQDETFVIIGQTREAGAVWVSSDNGLTWENGPDFLLEGYSMPQSGFTLEGKIFVTTNGTGCLVYNGQIWAESDCLASNIFEGTTSVQKNTIFQGLVAMAPYWATVDYRVHFFDGQSRWTVEFPQPVHDVVAMDGSLFVLMGEPSGLGAIYATQSLDCRCEQDFTRIVDLNFQDTDLLKTEDEFMRLMVGSTPQSLEYVAGQFYIGLADGRFFRSEIYMP